MKIIQTFGEIGEPPTFYQEFDFDITAEELCACLDYVMKNDIFNDMEVGKQSPI